MFFLGRVFKRIRAATAFLLLRGIKIDIDSLKGLTLESVSPGVNSAPVLVAEYANITPHLETGLEIAIRLAITGYKVVYCHYGKCLDLPDIYKGKNGIFFALFQLSLQPEEVGQIILQHLSSTYGLSIICLDALRFSQPNAGMHYEIPSSIGSLKSLSFNNKNLLGISVAGKLMSHVQAARPDPSEYISVCSSAIKTFLQSYDIASGVLQKLHISAAIVFNGRFPSCKGLVQRFQESAVPVFFHERGSTSAKYLLTPYDPSDRVCFQHDIIRNWDIQLNKRAAQEIAANYFNSVRRGRSIAWTSFVENQRMGTGASIVDLARESSPTKEVFCYFSGSDVEYDSVDDCWHSAPSQWHSQIELFKDVVDAAREAGASLVVRVHPNLAKSKSSDLELWNKLSFIKNNADHLFIVESESPVSTYELIDNVDLVLVGRSTVGLEAVYAGKPTIVLSDCMYDQIGVTIMTPRNARDLSCCIKNYKDFEVNSMSAIPYGHYWATFGSEYFLYKPTTLFSGKFCGFNLMVGVAFGCQKYSDFKSFVRSLIAR